MDKKIFLVFLILGFVLATPVLAQNIAQNFPQFPYQTWWNPDALATFLGVPSDWLVVPKVIYYVIVPFIVATTVVYGILVELNIFRSSRAYKVNIILSIAMAFLLLPSGILTIIVTYFYAAGTFIGLIGFGILFIFGVIAWVYGSGHRIWGEQVPASLRHSKYISNKIRDRLKEKRRIENQLLEAGIRKNADEITRLKEKESKINDEIKELETQLEHLRFASS